MKTYKAAELKKIVRRTNIRDYEYAAYVTKNTGRVIKLRAGCRLWLSFEQANKHYASDSVTRLGNPGRWSDEGTKGNTLMQSYREEARAILSRLENDVAAYVHKIKAKKRADRRK